MFKGFKKAALAVTVIVGSLSVATTAQARDRYYDRDNDAALAIGAGIIGLAIGAAIASDNDDRYDRRGYYYRSYPRGYYYDGYPRAYRYDRYRRDWRDGRRWNRDRNWNYNDRRRWRY